MRRITTPAYTALAIILLLAAGCSASGLSEAEQHGGTRVLAAETFLADIARNVAGDRLKVDALIPTGVDPHGFEPTPQDIRRVAESDVLIVNGAGFEAFLQTLLSNADGQRMVVEASAGLPGRTAREGEAATDAHDGEADPHFWLDPLNVVKYVENIRDGLSKADPGGATVYAANAEAYVTKLKELDGWIRDQVQQVPEARRLLVTNHESFGYFADRYGFRVVGTVIPNVSTAASPSAQQMTKLVEAVKANLAPAIFLETGSNPDVATQISRETGAKVVTGLLTHSVTSPDGAAPDYISMMRYDVRAIVEALK